MYNIIGKNVWDIKDNQTTPEHIFKSRRQVLQNLAGGSIALAGLASLPTAVFGNANSFYPATNNSVYKVNREITEEKLATTYTNFYEFGSSKNIWRRAALLKTKPWTLTIDGLVEKPVTIDTRELLKKVGGIEERVYRFRCVEAWSMTVPWSGFALNKILSLVEPKTSAKFLRFETFFDPDVAPGQKQKWYPWPYVEGITIDEAKNDLSFLATGIYGKKMPNQNGAPLRLVLPWKYGFKSIKSLVKISFVDKKPMGMWEKIAPLEYGFWANVNPNVSHPRWSQTTEQQLGVNGKIPTMIYNGYGSQVANMYNGLEPTLKNALFR
ncbi:protein-methionine-sulfoxide reductase catalytic subunit MsrP [Pseudomonadota bacterium]|nr:protein-methionine-sulfoxide reductase catalytic subunit MsrP [Pseudomonadota bacterium]